MSSATVGIATIIVTVVIFSFSQLCLAIWFASKVNTRIDIITKAIEGIDEDLKSIAKYDAAIQELQQSNQLDPYNIYRLALAYQGKGDTANARKFFERIVTFNGLNNLNYALIRTKAKQSAGKVS